MRIICEKLHGHWSAWIDGHSETAFGGRTYPGAVHRLVAELPGIDLSQFKLARDATNPGRIVISDLSSVLVQRLRRIGR